MTTASTELRYPAHRASSPSRLAAKLRYAEALIVLAVRGALALTSFAIVVLSIRSIALFGPQPVLSGMLIGFMIICLIRLEQAWETVKRKGVPAAG